MGVSRHAAGRLKRVPSSRVQTCSTAACAKASLTSSAPGVLLAQFIVEAPLLVRAPKPNTWSKILEHIGTQPAAVLDIGTGTGCIAVSVAPPPEPRHVATDINPRALAVAAERRAPPRRRTRAAPGQPFPGPRRRGPLTPSVQTALRRGFGVVGSIRHPPARRPRPLLAGPIALMVPCAHRRSPAWLTPGGLLAFEIGMGRMKQ